MHDDQRRQDSDLGEEQRRRVREEGDEFQPDAPTPAPELDSEEAGQRVEVVEDPDAPAARAEPADPEFREDLRRAEPNPPMTEPAEADPMSDVDLGYMEDQERETPWDLDTLEQPVASQPTDPLEGEREEQARPGPSTEQLEDETGNRPPGERDRR